MLWLKSKDKEIREQIRRQYERLKQQQNSPPSVQSEQSNQQHGAQIIFTVTTAGDVTIQLQWTQESNEVSEAVGSLLYFINNGNLKDQCRTVLGEVIGKKPKLSSFVKQILKSWDECKQRNEQVVKPSEVFQIGKQGLHKSQ